MKYHSKHKYVRLSARTSKHARTHTHTKQAVWCSKFWM